jgi:hypothetical protein
MINLTKMGSKRLRVRHRGTKRRGTVEGELFYGLLALVIWDDGTRSSILPDELEMALDD